MWNNVAQSFPEMTLTLSITEVLPPPDAVVSFVSLAASFPVKIINFSPIDLPSGVTYVLTDDRPTPNVWNSNDSDFDGKVNITDYNGLVNTIITFTQTFYLNNVEITSKKRIVTVRVHTILGSTDFTQPVTGDVPSVTLWYNP
jgi:hypothetical protein